MPSPRPSPGEEGLPMVCLPQGRVCYQRSVGFPCHMLCSVCKNLQGLVCPPQEGLVCLPQGGVWCGGEESGVPNVILIVHQGSSPCKYPSCLINKLRRSRYRVTRMATPHLIGIPEFSELSPQNCLDPFPHERVGSGIETSSLLCIDPYFVV